MNKNVLNFNEYRFKKIVSKKSLGIKLNAELTVELLRTKFELEQEMSKPVNNYKITLNATPEQYERMAKLMEW